MLDGALLRIMFEDPVCERQQQLSAREPVPVRENQTTDKKPRKNKMKRTDARNEYDPARKRSGRVSEALRRPRDRFVVARGAPLLAMTDGGR